MSIGVTLAVDPHRLDTVMSIEAERALPVFRDVINRNGALLRTLVRANASGRPGPRVQTGDYRRGISLQTGLTIGVGGGRVPFATVYTTSPQGQRLENGFVGVDSLGRSYHQPAFPHFAPALEQISPLLERDLNVAVDELARRIAS